MELLYTKVIKPTRIQPGPHLMPNIHSQNHSQQTKAAMEVIISWVACKRDSLITRHKGLLGTKPL